MNNKFILATTLFTLVSCGGKSYINKDLVFDGSYYSYKLEGNISKGTKYRFTSSLSLNNSYTYFGMSNYQGTKPYLDIGFNNTNKTVNVTNIYKYDGKNKVALQNNIQVFYYRDEEVLYMNNSIFTSGESLIIECTLTKNLIEGLWAYVGESEY